MRRSQAGFTLIELMIVVAIIALLGAFMVGVASRPYDANAQVVSEQMVSTLSLARSRAIATRKAHRVRIYTTGGEQFVGIQVYDVTGMAYTTNDDSRWATFEVRRVSKSAVIQTAVATAITTTGATPTLDDSLDYSVYFKPDGSATASTIYITDHNGTPHYYRVLVYHATGSSYAREDW